jgi:adenylate cyclase
MSRQAILGRAEQLYHDASPVAAEEMTAWLLGQDSFDEPALRLMMQAKAASGAISGAVKLYHRFKDTLQTELGVKPSQETTDCYHNLQRVNGLNSAVLDRPAVAVLPFINLSGDAEQEYFVDGLTEDIITELSYWRTFPVIARNSTFVYKGEAINPNKVAKELGAAFILEGSVRKSGSRIRVAAQLIDAKTSHHLWAEKFDREMSDIFELQDDLTRSIAAVIEPAIIRAEQNRVKSLGTRDIGAWDYYLRGVDLANQFTAEGHAQARRMFERALEVDPNYAKPYVGISSTYLQGIALKRVDDHDSAVTAAIDAASLAVELDENDSSAHVVLGVGYMWAGLYDQALAEARQAVECNPSNAFAYVSLGNLLDVCGEPELGIPLIEIGLKLNPLEPKRHFAMTWLAGAFLNARRYEEALAGLQRALSRQTDYPLTHLFKTICLVYMDQPDKARESLLDCERVDPGFAEEFLRWRAYKKDSDNEHMSDAIHKIGILT